MPYNRSLILILTLALSMPAPVFGQQSEPESSPLSKFSESLTALTRQVSPAVVEILTSGYIPEDDDQSASYARQQVIGSGVILSPDGYIVTNAHVIKGAKRINVVLNPVNPVSASDALNDAGARYRATIVGAHEDTDLAVLKIDAKNLPTIPLAQYSELRQGQIVIAVGNPIGMKNSVSIGVVSSVARQSSEEKPIVLIQTDAAINPGSSGGALVDTTGHLVGITCEVMSGERLGFAVPSDVVQFVYSQIRKTGKVHQGDIGVRVQNITPLIAKGLELPLSWGVIISDVKPGSPAARVGLRPSDVLLTVDGKFIGSSPEFETLLYFKNATEQILVTVLRKSGERTFRIPIVESDEPASHAAMLGSDPDNNLIRKLGIFAADVDQHQIEKQPGIRQPDGVLVSGKIADSQSLGSELQTGDIIHSINGQPVRDISSLRAVLEKVASGDETVLWIERQRTFLYLGLEAN